MKKKVSWNDQNGYELETIKYIPIPQKIKDNKENNDFISISPPIKIISPSNENDWTSITLKAY
tara:strand:- start:515 stop:703 length:189 start_codon:yes stop_codon:yes gene_type:complete